MRVEGQPGLGLGVLEPCTEARLAADVLLLDAGDQPGRPEDLTGVRVGVEDPDELVEQRGELPGDRDGPLAGGGLGVVLGVLLVERPVSRSRPSDDTPPCLSMTSQAGPSRHGSSQRPGARTPRRCGHRPADSSHITTWPITGRCACEGHDVAERDVGPGGLGSLIRCGPSGAIACSLTVHLRSAPCARARSKAAPRSRSTLVALPFARPCGVSRSTSSPGGAQVGGEHDRLAGADVVVHRDSAVGDGDVQGAAPTAGHPGGVRQAEEQALDGQAVELVAGDGRGRKRLVAGEHGRQVVHVREAQVADAAPPGLAVGAEPRPGTG